MCVLLQLHRMQFKPWAQHHNSWNMYSDTGITLQTAFYKQQYMSLPLVFYILVYLLCYLLCVFFVAQPNSIYQHWCPPGPCATSTSPSVTTIVFRLVCLQFYILWSLYYNQLHGKPKLWGGKDWKTCSVSSKPKKENAFCINDGHMWVCFSLNYNTPQSALLCLVPFPTLHLFKSTQTSPKTHKTNHVSHWTPFWNYRVQTQTANVAAVIILHIQVHPWDNAFTSDSTPYCSFDFKKSELVTH